jgi:hypothetical protein
LDLRSGSNRESEAEELGFRLAAADGVPPAQDKTHAPCPSHAPIAKPLGLRAFREVVYLPLDIRVQRNCDERVGASALPHVRRGLNATLAIHGLIGDSSAIQQEG